MMQVRTVLYKFSGLSSMRLQPFKAELPGGVNRPFIVVHLLLIITVFLQKFTTPRLVQFQIEAYITFRSEDICASLDHGQRKVAEFLHNSQRMDLQDKDDKGTFTIVMAGASVSWVCSRCACLSKRSLASSGFMSETRQNCGA